MLIRLVAVLVAAVIAATGTMAEVGQIIIEFGASAAQWSGNNLCDDPRFENKSARDVGMSARPASDALFQDADDCRRMFADGFVVPRLEFGDVLFSGIPKYESAYKPSADGIDNSPYLHAGHCSDPRLDGLAPGDGASRNAKPGDEFPFACRTPFLSGEAILKAWADGEQFLYGHDGGQFARDGECDDPRFEGEDMASAASRANVGRDAHDCRTGSVEMTRIRPQNGIEFGSNASRFSYDGECDDPRFEGEDMAGVVVAADLEKDAIDCFRAYRAGRIKLVELK